MINRTFTDRKEKEGTHDSYLFGFVSLSVVISVSNSALHFSLFLYEHAALGSTAAPVER